MRVRAVAVKATVTHGVAGVVHNTIVEGAYIRLHEGTHPGHLWVKVYASECGRQTRCEFFTAVFRVGMDLGDDTLNGDGAA